VNGYHLASSNTAGTLAISQPRIVLVEKINRINCAANQTRRSLSVRLNLFEGYYYAMHEICY